MRAKLRDIAAAAQFDPKQAILDALGKVAGIQIFHNLVLAATYIEPEMTPGGIIKPDTTLMENRFQGKIFLVVACGPMAFVDAGPLCQFGGDKVQPGEWVIARPSDGWELYKVENNSGVCCRIFEDGMIKGRVSDPELLW
jgi:hypothetical protein